MSTTTGNELSNTDAPTHRSRTNRTLVIALTLLLGMGILAALVIVTQNASAQTSPTAQKPDAQGSPDCVSSWTVVTSPNPGTYHVLNGVVMISGSDGWAVGAYDDATGNKALIEHWNGNTWTQVSSPNLGPSSTGLGKVSAVSANDVWAVGSSEDSNIVKTLIEHWDGNVWSIVPSPNPSPGTTDPDLEGVSAVSANDVWAVGYYINTNNLNRTLIEHWDGNVWSIVPSPNPLANNKLLAVSAVSANDVWAVGASYFNYATLIEHWNGNTWTQVSSPSPNSASGLNGVSAVSANNVWAVGFYNAGSWDGTLILHWNGNTWTQVSSPGPTNSYLLAVSAVSANNVWAVGYYDNQLNTLTEHWNGNTWTQVSSPSPGTADNRLYDVSAVVNSDIWAVGYHSNNTVSTLKTLVERYNSCIPTPTSTSTRTATRTRTPTKTPTITNTPIPLPSQCAIQFEDVPNPSTFYPYVQCLACRGIVSGYACGGPNEPCNATNDPYYRPNSKVTRGQVSKILVRAAGINNSVSGQSFEDVLPGSTFYTYTQELADLGVITGFPCGGTGEPCMPPADLPYFRPSANTTRGQVAKLDSNTAGFNDPPAGQSFEDVLPNNPFYAFIERLASRGIMTGFACGSLNERCVPPDNLPYFRPGNDVTRGQTAKTVSNTFVPNCQAP